MILQRLLVIVISILVLLYIFLLPTFWPKPEISVSVPVESNVRSNVEATITVHSWHSNFSLFAVDGIFEVGPGKNGGNSIVTVDLLPGIDNGKWDSDHAMAVSRLSFPRTFQYRIKLPLQDLYMRDIFSSNYLTGRISVRLHYPIMVFQRREMLPVTNKLALT